MVFLQSFSRTLGLFHGHFQTLHSVLSGRIGRPYLLPQSQLNHCRMRLLRPNGPGRMSRRPRDAADFSEQFVTRCDGDQNVTVAGGPPGRKEREEAASSGYQLIFSVVEKGGEIGREQSSSSLSPSSSRICRPPLLPQFTLTVYQES